ncbi:MAG: hypothetical protein KDD84_18845, partial [Caldilineaceae bacterium]|nr:hypothetical protein [Caldilineaceae bacterium]
TSQNFNDPRRHTKHHEEEKRRTRISGFVGQQSGKAFGLFFSAFVYLRVPSWIIISLVSPYAWNKRFSSLEFRNSTEKLRITHYALRSEPV